MWQGKQSSTDTDCVAGGGGYNLQPLPYSHQLAAYFDTHHTTLPAQYLPHHTIMPHHKPYYQVTCKPGNMPPGNHETMPANPLKKL